MNWKYFGLCLTFLIFILLGCASVAPVPDGSDKQRLIGYWFGVHQQEGIDGDIQAICHMKADGSFYIRFRIVKDGQPAGKQDESGHWELKDNVKTVVTTHINGRNLGESRYIVDKYLIRKLTDSEMFYEDMKTGTKFKHTRVKEGFEFP